MNDLTFIVFDFETGSPEPSTTVPLSLSAIAYHPRTLEPIPGAVFDSLMRPKDNEWGMLQDEALKINGLTREELKEAPERSVVWEQFVSFVRRFQKGKSQVRAPIPCGQNIKGFDLVITDRLCQEFGTVGKEGKPNLWNRRNQVDLMDLTFAWFENSDILPNFKLDTLREHFGLDKEGAHTSLVDVSQTGELIMRFLRLHRNLFHRVPGLKGAAVTAA